MLAARGFDALIEPLLEIHDRETAVDLSGVQAILCTSANGVRALARVSSDRALPVFAVGKASAAAARTAGFSCVASADGAIAELARLVRRRLDPAAGRLLHVAGTAVAGDLAGMLRQDGFLVDRAILYEARAATRLSPACIEALAAGSIDVALFFSPRSAATFADLAAVAGLGDALGQVVAISISAAADRGLGALPFAARKIAARPDQTSLLDALDRLVAARQPA